MIYINYVLAAFTKPPTIPHQETVSEDEYCHVCNTWKPERTRHCKQCKMCVAKYDHHCPWIGSCVGYHNFKYFIHFSMWCWLATTLYTFEAVRFSFFMNGISSRMAILGRLIYWMTNCFFCPIAVIFGPMILMNLFMVFNNLTHIENMTSHERRVPCFKPSPSLFNYTF